MKLRIIVFVLFITVFVFIVLLLICVLLLLLLLLLLLPFSWLYCTRLFDSKTNVSTICEGCIPLSLVGWSGLLIIS